MTARGGFRWGALRPYPFEWIVVPLAAATFFYLRGEGLRYGWNTVEHTLDAMWRTLALMLPAGVFLVALRRRLAGDPVGPYLRAVATPGWLQLWVRVALSFVLYVYAYTWLKVSVPLIRAEIFDHTLWRIDRALHFGISPTVLAIELVADTPFAGWIDRYYAYWIFVIPLVTAYAFALERGDQRRNFALGAAVMWIAGSWIYLAMPSVGPCYWSPDVMAPVAADMPLAIHTQGMLWSQYKGLLASRGGMLQVFSPALGVAALPSLHVAAYAYFAFWSRRHHRAFFPLWVAATVAIHFGTLATGWHYAIDGYLGVLLAWLATRIADTFEPAATAATAPHAEAPP